MYRTLGIIVLIGLFAGSHGCARKAVAPRSISPATTMPATRPAQSDSRALLPLDLIEPIPQFEKPSTVPTTSDAGEAPLEAIELFARARDARARNQPYSAINLLERAIKLDPHSFELHFALGSAYQRGGNAEKAIDAYQRAAAIRPDDLVLHAELGRAYMQRGDTMRGIRHLRLARATEDYQNDTAAAAAVDYRLGLALQQGGYDRAALDVYEGLFRRLREPSSPMRVHSEIAYLMNRPEFLLEQVGRLYEKHGQYEESLSAWQFIAERAPEDFAAQARVVDTLQRMGRTDEALKRAVELVTQFRASSESLAKLRAVYGQAGRRESLVEELRRLHERRPQDRVVLFALADALDAVDRPEQAEQLLLEAAQKRDGDVEIIWRLGELLIARGQLDRAARILIEMTAQRPNTTSELLPMWARLTSPGRKDALRVEDLRRLNVSPEAEPARLYYLWRVGRAWNRPSVAHSSLERAVRLRPAFPSAFREMLDDIWAEDHFDQEQKQRRSGELIELARQSDNPALALELQGAAALARKDYEDAAKSFEEALRRAGPSPAPDLLMSQIVAERARSDLHRFEQLAWRLVSDHPRYEPVYVALFRHYMESGNVNGARNLLGRWLANLPDSVEGRLVEATVQLRINKQPEQAEQTLLAILAEHADRLDVLVNLRAMYGEKNQLNKFIDLIEQERIARPYNYAAAAILVDAYASQKRLTEAARVLDAARAALSDDPDRLYFIAHLYQRIEQPRQSEEVLEQVLRIDPSFAPAANDLGYMWADAGKNLHRAEAMIRRAVEAEPDNPMYLDSLGWVLYKQGRFDEARRPLEEAAADERGADAVILDHLGDVLYRLNQTDAAIKRWRAALERIVAAGDEPNPQQYNALRLQLDQKLKHAERSEPVSVAPVVAMPTVSGQAKN